MGHFSSHLLLVTLGAFFFGLRTLDGEEANFVTQSVNDVC